MPVYLPANLAVLARLAPKESPRYRLDCVRVIDPGDGTYRVDVTDGRRLAIVRGSVQQAAYEAVESSADGTAEILVPLPTWAQAFKSAGRDPVGLGVDDDGLILATRSGARFAAPSPEGRYPDCDAVLPKSAARWQVRVDPLLLGGLLQVAAALGLEGVDLLYFAKDKPLGLIGRNDQGQYLDALIMPLA
jgi:hypothetical protein